MLDDWHRGRSFGFPACCVLRFCLSSGEQAVRRGIRCHMTNPHVPCNVFHRGIDYAKASTEMFLLDWEAEHGRAS